jgi:hypothetical protein
VKGKGIARAVNPLAPYKGKAKAAKKTSGIDWGTGSSSGKIDWGG